MATDAEALRTGQSCSRSGVWTSPVIHLSLGRYIRDSRTAVRACSCRDVGAGGNGSRLLAAHGMDMG